MISPLDSFWACHSSSVLGRRIHIISIDCGAVETSVMEHQPFDLPPNLQQTSVTFVSHLFSLAQKSPRSLTQHARPNVPNKPHCLGTSHTGLNTWRAHADFFALAGLYAHRLPEGVYGACGARIHRPFIEIHGRIASS
jgi:hypothetical protein